MRVKKKKKALARKLSHPATPRLQVWSQLKNQSVNQHNKWNNKLMSFSLSDLFKINKKMNEGIYKYWFNINWKYKTFLVWYYLCLKEKSIYICFFRHKIFLEDWSLTREMKQVLAKGVGGIVPIIYLFVNFELLTIWIWCYLLNRICVNMNIFSVETMH